MRTVAATLLALLTTLPGAASTVVVIDGDTVDIAGERIRIANIDAPETHSPKCPSEKTLGLRATGRLSELLASGLIVINRGDPQDGRLRDRHGRTLATLSVNGRDVGAILVSERLARPWTGKRRPWCGVSF